MKAIVLAGSKGIGKGISDQLHLICDEVVSTSSSDLDTSELDKSELDNEIIEDMNFDEDFSNSIEVL